MGIFDQWFETQEEQEERLRQERAAAGLPEPNVIRPIQPDNEPIWSILGRLMSVSGTPGGIKPSSEMSPEEVSQLPKYLQTPQVPQDYETPLEKGYGAFANIIGMGAEKVVLKDPQTGTKTTIGIKHPEPNVAQQQGAPPGTPPAGWSNFQDRQDMLGGAGTFQPPQPPQQPATPPPPMVDTEADKLAAARYGSHYQPGTGPKSPMEEYQQKMAWIEQQRREKESAAREAFPERGEVLGRAYEAVGKRHSKGMRILMSILAQDPFYTDKLAAAEADYELARRRYIGDKSLSSIDADYKARMEVMDKLVTRQQTEREDVVRDLQNRLALNPQLKNNRKFLRDWALAFGGIPESYVDQYLDDHYDPTKGEYTLVTDPYTARVRITKYNAQALQEINPSLPNDIAIAAAADPKIALEYLLNDKRRMEMDLARARTPEEADAIRHKLNLIAAVERATVSDPKFIRLTMLEGERESPNFQRYSPEQREDWKKRYKTAHDEYYGPDPEKDAETLFLKRRQYAANINHILMQTKKLAQDMADKEAKKSDTNITTDIIKSQAGGQAYGVKGTSTKQNADMQNKLIWLTTTAMTDPKYVPAGEDALYFQNMSKAILKRFPTDAVKIIGDLTPQEAAQIYFAIQRSENNGEIPNYGALAAFVIQSRPKKK